MIYAENPIRKYLNDAASNMPAPGGGSIAAAVGALGASMAAMVANFTVGREKYADVEDEAKELLERVEIEREKLTRLVDEDVAVYGKVSRAYGMLKSTDDSKAARSAAIKDACREAMAVPMEIVRSCAEVARVTERLVDIGNINLITDVGVSVLAADAACMAAALNVEINLASIGDREFAAETRKELDSLLANVKKTAESVMEKVKAAI